MEGIKGSGILGFCIIIQQPKETLLGQQDHFLLAPAVATCLH